MPMQEIRFHLYRDLHTAELRLAPVPIAMNVTKIESVFSGKTRITVKIHGVVPNSVNLLTEFMLLDEIENQFASITWAYKLAKMPDEGESRMSPVEAVFMVDFVPGHSKIVVNGREKMLYIMGTN